MHDHENQGDDGNTDAMPDVGAEERVGVHDGAAQQTKADVVVRSHAHLRAERSLVAEKRSGARHVGAYGDSPEAELIVGKQITGEREQQRQHQKDHAYVPIKLARLLVRAGEKDTEHMQFYGDYHQVRGPAVHVAEQFTERDVVFEVKDVAEGLHLAGVVVKHQQDTSEGEHQKQIESDAAHAPGVAVTHGVAINLGRVQMQKNVGEDAESAVARRVVVLVAEDGGVELSFGGILEAFDLFFGFRRHITFKREDGIPDGRQNSSHQPDRFAVGVFLVRHSLLPALEKRARHGR